MLHGLMQLFVLSQVVLRCVSRDVYVHDVSNTVYSYINVKEFQQCRNIKYEAQMLNVPVEWRFVSKLAPTCEIIP